MSGHLANEIIFRQLIHANLAHIHTMRACGICHVWDTAARIDIIRSSVWHVIMSAHLLFRSSFLQVSLEITGRQLRSRAPGARIRRRRRHDSSSSARYWDTHTHTHSSGTKSRWMMLQTGKRHAFRWMDGTGYARLISHWHAFRCTARDSIWYLWLWPAGARTQENIAVIWWKV